MSKTRLSERWIPDQVRDDEGGEFGAQRRKGDCPPAADAALLCV